MTYRQNSHHDWRVASHPHAGCSGGSLKRALAGAASVSLTLAPVGAALAQNAAADEDSETLLAPKPSMMEELVYIRDQMAHQGLRLDEAEQLIARQSQLIEAQQNELQALRAALTQYGPVAVAGGNYIVRRGDTLSAIAERHGVSVQAMVRANNIRNASLLSVGQRLVIPGVAAAPTIRTASIEAEPRPETVDRATKADQARRDAARKAEEAARQQQNAAAPKPQAPATPDEPEEVGQRPEDEGRPPYISLFSDIGGILTPRGALYAEPGFSYTATSDNRFFFQGTEILDAILIGVIEATDSDRTALTGRMGMRYGVTSRFEIDAKASYVYRDDRVSGIAIDDNGEITRNLDGDGFGDLEFGLHYQLNQGKKFPYAILNMRTKAPTGRGPFDVAREQNGTELELASGSGFWTLEPSMTFILPTAPASVFANIGYQFNLETTPNEVIGARTIESFNPGDAITANLGVGLSLNERFSMSFGYNQSHFFPTKSRFRDAENNIVTSRQTSATVGSFGIGGSYTINNGTRINLNTSFGATDEAPDLQLSIRLQKLLME